MIFGDIYTCRLKRVLGWAMGMNSMATGGLDFSKWQEILAEVLKETKHTLSLICVVTCFPENLEYIKTVQKYFLPIYKVTLDFRLR